MAIETNTVAEMFEAMKKNLSHVVPEFELRQKAEIAFEINRLKKEKHAVILGHNYMEAALFFSVPDYVGDSLELSRRAAEADCDIIIFCGVKFMAETAKILNPEKQVLLPTLKGGCSLAESITAEDVRALKKMYPGVPVVTYINTYADVKAETDICCTSGNAVRVVNSLEGDKVIFLPDEYLAGNVARETGKKVIFPTLEPGKALAGDADLDYQIIGWRGKCEVHDEFTLADVENARKQFPGVMVLAHPECKPEVAEAADYSASTSAMINFIKKSDAPNFLLLTECSMADNIVAQNPEKEMVRMCSVRCPHMNEITLENVLDALQNSSKYEVNVPEDIRLKALSSVQRMLDL
jgi:quinolinate synthase